MVDECEIEVASCAAHSILCTYTYPYMEFPSHIILLFDCQLPIHVITEPNVDDDGYDTTRMDIDDVEDISDISNKRSLANIVGLTTNTHTHRHTHTHTMAHYAD